MGLFVQGYFCSFLQVWLATVQEVLQADWQEAWHSPQPELADVFMQGFWMVVTCFMVFPPVFDFLQGIIHKSTRLGQERATA